MLQWISSDKPPSAQASGSPSSSSLHISSEWIVTRPTSLSLCTFETRWRVAKEFQRVKFYTPGMSLRNLRHTKGTKTPSTESIEPIRSTSGWETCELNVATAEIPLLVFTLINWFLYMRRHPSLFSKTPLANIGLPSEHKGMECPHTKITRSTFRRKGF